MFERVITQTIQRISSEVLRDRQSIPLTEILEDERIPSRFKPFFATEVRWWLYNDALARSANKRFDADHPEVASLLDYLEQVMFRHARFEHDEFVSTLDGAVKLTFNYLCRPQTTLKWYIFRGQPVKPLNEVMLRFESFLDYEYIGNVFAEWVERKVRERATFEAISATEFERIIRRIDDQILLSCTVDELLGLLDPIFDFIGEGDAQVVPLDALIIYFDDKNIARLVDHLEGYRETNPLVSRARFVGILEELLTSAEENPEADFSSVYQNDELDDIVQRHLEAEGKVAPPHGVGETAAHGNATETGETAEVNSKAPEPATTVVEPATSVKESLATEETRPSSIDEPAASVDEPAAADHEPAAADHEPAATVDQHAAPVIEAAETVDEPAANVENGTAPAEESSANIEVHPVDDRAASVEEPIASVDENAATDMRDETAASDLDGADETSNEPSAAQATVGTSEDGELAADDAEMLESADADRGDRSALDIETAATEDITPTLENGTAAAVAAPVAVHAGLDPMLERKILKKIFSRDRAAYDEAMIRLTGATTWRQASQVLDELFIRFDVDPYSRTALRFTDSIYTRYVPKSHN